MKLRVKLDPRFPLHRKIRRLTADAFRLHVHGICLAVLHETDGLLTFEQAWELTRLGNDHVAVFDSNDERRALLTELVHAGVWERTDDGDFRIHDFAEYQDTRATVETRRHRWRTKKAKQRGSPGESPRGSPGESHARTRDRGNGGVAVQTSVLTDSAVLGSQRAAPKQEHSKIEIAGSDFGRLEPFRRLAEFVTDSDVRSPAVWRSAARGVGSESAAAQAQDAVVARRAKPGPPLNSEARFVTSVLRRLSDEARVRS